MKVQQASTATLQAMLYADITVHDEFAQFLLQLISAGPAQVFWCLCQGCRSARPVKGNEQSVQLFLGACKVSKGYLHQMEKGSATEDAGQVGMD